MKTIPFTKEDIKKYLDDCITHWRMTRDNKPLTHEDKFRKGIAPYYIDAFQSVRTTLFGKTKK